MLEHLHDIIWLGNVNIMLGEASARMPGMFITLNADRYLLTDIHKEKMSDL